MTPIDQRTREAAEEFRIYCDFGDGPLWQEGSACSSVLEQKITALLTDQHAEDVAAGEKQEATIEQFRLNWQSASTETHRLLARVDRLRGALEEISKQCPHVEDTDIGSLSDYGSNGDDYAAAFAKVTDSAIGDIARAALAQPTQP